MNRCTCYNRFPIKKLSEGKYQFGDQKTLIFVRVRIKYKLKTTDSVIQISSEMNFYIVDKIIKKIYSRKHKIEKIKDFYTVLRTNYINLLEFVLF